MRQIGENDDSYRVALIEEQRKTADARQAYADLLKELHDSKSGQVIDIGVTLLAEEVQTSSRSSSSSALRKAACRSTTQACVRG